MGPYRHILAPTDFSGPSQRALDAAVELAVAFELKLTITHTFEVPWYVYAGDASAPIDCITQLQEAARTLLSSTLERVRERIPSATAELRSGVPWEEILAVAKDVGADLIVMGTHGRSGLAHALIGSVAEKVVRYSPIPVLTIRSQVPDARSVRSSPCTSTRS